VTDRAGHLDELNLSDVLDGEADPAVTEHLSGCPSCQAELARWEAVTGQVGAAPPGPPAGARDRAIAAARDAWAPSETGRSRRRLAAWAAAAAAVIVVAVGITVGALTGGGSSKSSSSAGSPAGPAATAPSSTREGPAPEPTPEPAPEGAASAAPADGFSPLEAQTPDELRSALEATLASGARPVAAEQGCASEASQHAGRAGAAAELSQEVVYRSDPAVVFVYPAGAGHVAVVVTVTGCRVLTVFAL
jgi:hypothetical protein